jgi:hypothetical protein
MVSRSQADKVNTMLREGWTAVPRSRPMKMGGPTLLRRDEEYVFVAPSGQTVPATPEQITEW